MSEKRRIWFISRSLPEHISGGMERVARDTSFGLARRGWEVHLVVPRTPAGLPDLPPDLYPHELDAPAGVPYGRFARALRRWAARQKRAPDLIFSPTFAANKLLPLLPGVPAIFQAHGSSWFEATGKLRRLDPRGLYRLGLYLSEERRFLARYDRIVAIGPAVVSYFASPPYRFLADQKLVMIPNGLDTDSCQEALGLDRSRLRQELGVAEDDRLIFTACRLIPEKGLMDLLQAYTVIPERDKVAIHIAGSGRDEKRLRAFCDRRRLSRVRFLGLVDHARVLEMLRASDLLVQIGTRPEGLPLIVLESLCTGCPVLLSERLPVPDFGQVGVLSVDPTDHRQIAAALQRGLQLGAPLMETARLAQDQFSLATMLDRYEELIESLLGGTSRASSRSSRD